MKVGISFVSVADAAAQPGVRRPGLVARPGGVPGHRPVEQPARPGPGGWRHRQEQRTFYTALYHSLLSPNVVSDDNGELRRCRRPGPPLVGRDQYANFSEWDIYRSEIQLVALLAPHQAGDMVQSLVNDAAQGGWLPKWAIVGGDAAQMNGDSADPIIAGPTPSACGTSTSRPPWRPWSREPRRPRPPRAGDRTAVPRPVSGPALRRRRLSGSDSIDYSDRGVGDPGVRHRRLLHRPVGPDPGGPGPVRHHDAAGPTNGSTCSIRHRVHPGPQRRRQLPTGPAFQTVLLEPGGELGFEEGNAIQYTWSVPQDLAARPP